MMVVRRAGQKQESFEQGAKSLARYSYGPLAFELSGHDL